MTGQAEQDPRGATVDSIAGVRTGNTSDHQDMPVEDVVITKAEGL